MCCDKNGSRTCPSARSLIVFNRIQSSDLILGHVLEQFLSQHVNLPSVVVPMNPAHETDSADHF